MYCVASLLLLRSEAVGTPYFRSGASRPRCKICAETDKNLYDVAGVNDLLREEDRFDLAKEVIDLRNELVAFYINSLPLYGKTEISGLCKTKLIGFPAA